MRSTRVKLAIAVAVLGVAVTTTAAVAGGGGKTKAKLSGFEEVPAVITTGEGKLKLKINKSSDTIDYTLSYSGLEGTAVQAHIHIGQRTANGSIAAFLCGGGDKPPCPPSGTVSGTIDRADVLATTNPPQGVEAGDFEDFVRAIRAGVAYANVHTTKHTGGEIRGQIGGKGDDNGHGGDDDSDDG